MATALWALVFLALNFGTSDRVTLNDVLGSYKLLLSGQPFYWSRFELRGTEAVLNYTDVFMDGVPFVIGYVNLSVTPGHIDWNAEEGSSDWNCSFGPVVNGAISMRPKLDLK